MTINEMIGLYLKSQRERCDLSLMDVSRLVGKSKYTIHGYEKGENNITAETLMKICRVYGISINDVYKYVERYL